MTTAKVLGGVGVVSLAGLVVGAALTVPVLEPRSIMVLGLLALSVLIAVVVTAATRSRSTPYW